MGIIFQYIADAQTKPARLIILHRQQSKNGDDDTNPKLATFAADVLVCRL